MGRTDERPSAERLLRERSPGRDGGGLARFVRNLFWDDRWPGLLLAGCGRHLEADRTRLAGGSVGRSPNVEMIRVVLPHHLRTLARVSDEVQLELNGSATIRSVLDALEKKYPMLQGTIRDHGTLKRRPMVRVFVCGEDLSHESPDAPLPEAIKNGAEPFFIMGAIAGG